MNGLKGYRAKYRVTQEEMAKVLGITRSNYVMTENGTNNRQFKMNQIKAIIEFFKNYEPDVTFEKIFG